VREFLSEGVKWCKSHVFMHFVSGPPNGPVLFCAGCRLSSSSVMLLVGRQAGRQVRRPSAVARKGVWAVGRPTLHGGPVRLRLVRAKPCRSCNMHCCTAMFSCSKVAWKCCVIKLPVWHWSYVCEAAVYHCISITGAACCLPAAIWASTQPSGVDILVCHWHVRPPLLSRKPTGEVTKQFGCYMIAVPHFV